MFFIVHLQDRLKSPNFWFLYNAKSWRCTIETSIKKHTFSTTPGHLGLSHFEIDHYDIDHT